MSCFIYISPRFCPHSQLYIRILKFIPFRVHATYNGTIEERKKIKKGELSITKIKDTYYEYYNHNAPISSKENRFYYNWINSLNFTINCLDGVIKDSKEKMKRMLLKLNIVKCGLIN